MTITLAALIRDVRDGHLTVYPEHNDITHKNDRGTIVKPALVRTALLSGNVHWSPKGYLAFTDGTSAPHCRNCGIYLDSRDDDHDESCILR